MSSTTQFGLIGLAVMGENLALNIARNGFSLAVFNRTTSKVDDFVDNRVEDEPIVGTRSLEEFAATLERPRRMILLVKAGGPVDATIEGLLPHLDPGDLIIDAGNSHPDDTQRRAKDLESKGLRFVGMGVSGGEEGALNGPSIMPGGPTTAWDELAPMLEAIAAKVDTGPCVTHIGPGGAGHFVKMVHNGIEYGDMQLIAEAYDLMHCVLGMHPAQLSDVFRKWNNGPLESYLIEITGEIFAREDDLSGEPLVDKILDRAGQKGTGRWTSSIALDLGVSLPTIHAAVEARVLSSQHALRQRASGSLKGPDTAHLSDPTLIDAIHDALYASKICSYAQGLDLMATASREHEWDLDLGAIARIWKGGCIIRARFLDDIARAYGENASLENLMLAPQFATFLQDAQANWRRVVALAAEFGVPVLAMAGSLSYFDSLRRARLPQNLTQAQRDFFGAHTFERVDKPAGEWFHADWVTETTA